MAFMDSAHSRRAGPEERNGRFPFRTKVLAAEKETSFSARLKRGILLSTFLGFLLIPTAHGEPSQDKGLAASICDALIKAKTNKVVVFDFMGPDERLMQLGRDLADRFSRTLASAGGKFTVIDRPQVQAVIEKNRVAPDVIRDPEIAWWLARQLNADALIVGQLTASTGDTLRIAVDAAKTKDGKEIANLAVEVPFTNDMKMKTRLSESLSLRRTGDWIDSKYPNELMPKCIYCPRADFSGAALAQKKEGTVQLIVQVTEEGFAKDIEFVQAQPYGLTQKAIEAVQKWKFRPALSPDGKPRPVWQQIQVEFRFR